jgi:hypothetical protein
MEPWQGDEDAGPVDTWHVGTCRVCQRAVMSSELTTEPQAGDAKVVQIPGWGLACTAHRGVVEFFATTVAGRGL